MCALGNSLYITLLSGCLRRGAVHATTAAPIQASCWGCVGSTEERTGDTKGCRCGLGVGVRHRQQQKHRRERGNRLVAWMLQRQQGRKMKVGVVLASGVMHKQLDSTVKSFVLGMQRGGENKTGEENEHWCVLGVRSGAHSAAAQSIIFRIGATVGTLQRQNQ